jgi:outer membrane immunogenic protein
MSWQESTGNSRRFSIMRGRKMHHQGIVASGLLSVFAFAGIGAASAADLPARVYSKAPAGVSAVAYNWTGCYIGGNAGGGFAHTRQEFARVPFTGILFSDSRGDDIIGGGQLGCDVQLDRFVIGAQGEFDFGRINSSAIEPLFPTFTSSAQTKQIFTATARAGYLVTPTVLAYIKGGAAWAETYLAVTGSVPATFLSESALLNRSGWTAGGGAEWMFAPGWSVFAEYNYMDFGNGIAPYVSGPNTVGPPNVLNARLTVQTALVGVNYKFSWANPVVAKY